MATRSWGVSSRRRWRAPTSGRVRARPSLPLKLSAAALPVAPRNFRRSTVLNIHPICGPAPHRSAGKRQFGYSRDKRSDCVQVVIALVVTPQGFPLAYEVMPGNTSDKTTLKDFLAQIEAQYGLTSPSSSAIARTASSVPAAVILDAATHWPEVVVVDGNHEYYDTAGATAPSMRRTRSGAVRWRSRPTCTWWRQAKDGGTKSTTCSSSAPTVGTTSKPDTGIAIERPRV